MTNLFHDLPASLPEELVSVLASNQHLRIERIVSTGHASPDDFWYDQEEHEWITVLRGSATLAFEGGTTRKMLPGDHLLIPCHCRHRVEATDSTEPTVWLAVFFKD